MDRAKIRIQGGHGGNGVTAFRRRSLFPAAGHPGARADAVAMFGLSQILISTLCCTLDTTLSTSPNVDGMEKARIDRDARVKPDSKSARGHADL